MGKVPTSFILFSLHTNPSGSEPEFQGADPNSAQHRHTLRGSAPCNPDSDPDPDSDFDSDSDSDSDPTLTQTLTLTQLCT
eukprot:365862-Chlamydomonas_euryale.AAC.7